MAVPPPSVLFYAELAEPFVPSDLERRALGGSETALIQVARGLAGAGHRVTVVTQVGEQADTYDGVEYADLRSPAWRTRRDVDVTVVFRQLPHVTRRLPGRRRLLWAHDHIGIYPELPDGPRRKVLAAAWRLGYRLFGRYAAWVVPVSRWLGRCYVEFGGWPERLVRPIPNGVDGRVFASVEPASHDSRASLRVAYTSVPERGLELLLRRIMPAVWSADPSVELHVFSYRPLEVYRSLVPPGASRVHLRGGLPQPELARELRKFDLWVYPTDFPETFCIAALEAQAAGVPVVTSRRYALQETVEDGRTGVLVPGPVGSAAYVERFVREVVELLNHPERRAAMGRAARQRVLAHYTWGRVVQRWSDFLWAVARDGGGAWRG